MNAVDADMLDDESRIHSTVDVRNYVFVFISADEIAFCRCVFDFWQNNCRSCGRILMKCFGDRGGMWDWQQVVIDFGGEPASSRCSRFFKGNFTNAGYGNFA